MSDTTTTTCSKCMSPLKQRDIDNGDGAVWVDVIGGVECSGFDAGSHAPMPGLEFAELPEWCFNEDSEHECDSECDISALSESLRKVTAQLEEAIECITELRAEKRRAEVDALIARRKRNTRRLRIATIAAFFGLGVLRGMLQASIAAAQKGDA
jgi:hypothetical protein